MENYRGSWSKLFEKAEWEKISAICLELTNAGLADDTVLSESKFNELSWYCEELFKKYGQHPILLETLADFTSDVAERLELYSHASTEAIQRGHPIYTIHISWARLLLEECDDPKKALRILRQCRDDVTALGDNDERAEFAQLWQLAIKNGTGREDTS